LFGKWKSEAVSPLRRSIVLCVLLAVLVFGWLWWRNLPSHQHPGITDGVVIEKQPVNFATRTFDPENPPADMPPFAPGEAAVCDSNFLARANVGGDAEQTDATHVIVTVTHVKVELQLNITIWVPANATQHVIEHEEGHREISEYFYKTADKLAGQIAATYLGKQDLITGTDLHAELSKSLQQMGNDITEQYNKELNPEPAQLRYDAITDHSRNEVSAKDAVAQALAGTPLASAEPCGWPPHRPFPRYASLTAVIPGRIVQLRCIEGYPAAHFDAGNFLSRVTKIISLPLSFVGLTFRWAAPRL
jgi:hypothetical protein